MCCKCVAIAFPHEIDAVEEEEEEEEVFSYSMSVAFTSRKQRTCVANVLLLCCCCVANVPLPVASGVSHRRHELINVPPSKQPLMVKSTLGVYSGWRERERERERERSLLTIK